MNEISNILSVPGFLDDLCEVTLPEFGLLWIFLITFDESMQSTFDFKLDSNNNMVLAILNYSFQGIKKNLLVLSILSLFIDRFWIDAHHAKNSLLVPSEAEILMVGWNPSPPPCHNNDQGVAQWSSIFKNYWNFFFLN